MAVSWTELPPDGVGVASRSLAGCDRITDVGRSETIPPHLSRTIRERLADFASLWINCWAQICGLQLFELRILRPDTLWSESDLVQLAKPIAGTANYSAAVQTLNYFFEGIPQDVHLSRARPSPSW